jgi:F-type H+-transporting ATPase subunit b
MTFNWWTFLFEVLNFVVLAYVLHRLLYRPLRDAIDQRRESNDRAKAEAAKAHQEAQSLQQKFREQLAAAEQQRQDIIHQGREQAETERKKMMTEAEQSAQRRQEDARQALDRDRQEALTSVREEVVGQAIQLTKRLLEEASDRTLHQQLLLRLVQYLEQLPQAEREKLRQNWQPHDAVVLETAQNLDGHALEPLTAAVDGILGQNLVLTVQNRPQLIGGVRLLLAGNVWDCSLAGQVAGFSQRAEGDA